MEKSTLYLIDGSSYIFRAYYAIRTHLSTSDGFPTNAIHGFTSMIFKFIKDYDPKYLGIVFDSKGETFRNEIYPEYKANRDEPPEDLKPQFPRIFEIVDALGIPQIQREGFEADDLMGTIAEDMQEESVNVVLVTGDKDFCQLVSEKVKLLDTMKNQETDIEGVVKKFGVPPERVTDFLALTGDSSDNIPGVYGIGDKTAEKLLKKHKSLDNILQNLQEVNTRQRNLIEENRENAVLSKELVTIKTDIDLGLTLDDFKYEGYNQEELREIFKELELKNLLREIGESEDSGGKSPESDISREEYRLILSEEDLNKALARIRETGELSIDLETTSTDPMRAEIVGIALCPAPGEAYYVPVAHTSLEDASKQLNRSAVLEMLKPVVESEKIDKIGQNVKYEIVVLKRYGLDLKGISFDTMIAAHLIDSSKNRYNLDALSVFYLNHDTITYKDVTGSGRSKIDFEEVEIEKAKDYSSEDADVAMALSKKLLPQLEDMGLVDVFKDTQLKFIEVLARMEMKGVKVDSGKLNEMSREFEEGLKEIEDEIYSHVGHEFNVNSPLQLREVLFVELDLPTGKLTSTGEPSTDVEVLTDLSKRHPVPELVLDYRGLMKLKSTYVDALPKLIHPETGRIHTSFNPVGTSTGRLSSSEPNLQNIPIRTEEGKRIREAFIPEEGYLLLSADYSQIELRLLAHFSKDERLVKAFLEGSDIHSRTASEIFGVSENSVTADMRRLAKNINFGIIYGISPFGLAKQLGTSVSVAKGYIEEYFKRYKKVKEYIDGSIESAKKNGYAETILGRRRPLPELKSKSHVRRNFGERAAINAPIQGSAADIINIAMIRIDGRLRAGFSSDMILQVHDELLFEVRENEIDRLSDMVKEEMEGAWELNVPIRVDIGTGKNWAEAH